MCLYDGCVLDWLRPTATDICYNIPQSSTKDNGVELLEWSEGELLQKGNCVLNITVALDIHVHVHVYTYMYYYTYLPYTQYMHYTYLPVHASTDR